MCLSVSCCFSIVMQSSLAQDAEAAFEPLNCVACAAGQYLDQLTLNCTSCPLGSSTFAYTNASSAADCLCSAGYENTTDSSECVPCVVGKYKDSLANVSCSSCLPNSETVTSAADNVDDCICHAGYTKTNPLDHIEECAECAAGKFKGELGDGECSVCLANHYCPAASITPLACPPNSSSVVGSSVIEDCLCGLGFHTNNGQDDYYACVQCQAGKYNDHVNQTSCFSCPVNTYNPSTASDDLNDCLACDPNSASAQASTSIEDCHCNLGYAGNPGTNCEACAPGTYNENLESYICDLCPAGTYNVDVAADSHEHCLTCATNTNSVAGSGSQRDCVCNAGFFSSLQYATFDASDTSDPTNSGTYSYYECTACAAGSYNSNINSTSCDLCAAGKFSTDLAAITESSCTTCTDGKFTDEPGLTQCTSCPPSTWQDLSIADSKSKQCSACPQNSTHESTGVYDVETCKCVPGLKREDHDDVFVCSLCDAGSFCPHSGLIEPCAVNFFSEVGVTVECTQCAQFSQGIYGDQGLDTPSKCQCIAGAEGTFHDDCTLCVAGKFQLYDYTFDGSHWSESLSSSLPTVCLPCASGTFQPAEGSSSCSACPGNSSTTSVGHVALTDCTCNAGFTGNDGGECLACAVGKYCPGGSLNPFCRVFSSSAPRSISEHDCSCNTGYYSLATNTSCLKCPAGTFCPGGIGNQPCPGNSSSIAGADATDDCVCRSGYWRGCVLNAQHEYVDTHGIACTLDYTRPCVQCGPDDICFNDTLLLCPEFSTSPAGSSLPQHCICDDGYYAEHHDDDDHDDH